MDKDLCKSFSYIIYRKQSIYKKEDIKKLEIDDRKLNIRSYKDLTITIIGPRRADKTFACYYLIKMGFKRLG